MANENSNDRAVEHLLRATNAHDIDGIVACFTEDYALDAPSHPARSFRGREQVRRNWTQILGAVPDLAARLLRIANDGATAWTEWEMSGTHRDGTVFLTRGVFIFGIDEGRFRWGRMYLEPVDASGGDMNAALRQLLRPDEGGGAS